MVKKAQEHGFSFRNVKKYILHLIRKLIGGAGNNLLPFLFILINPAGSPS